LWLLDIGAREAVSADYGRGWQWKILKPAGTNSAPARFSYVDKRWKQIEVDNKGPGSASYRGFLLLLSGMRDQIRAEGTTIQIVYVAGAFFLPSGVV
jgi:hypothetical protein